MRGTGTRTRTPPPLAGGGWGEGAQGVWHGPLPPTPSRKGRGRILVLLSALPSVFLLLAMLGIALDRAFPPNLTRLTIVGTEVLDRQDRPLALLPAPGGVWRFRADSEPPLLTSLL